MNKIDWIRSQLFPEENAYMAVSRLNTPVAIPNPTPQGQVFSPTTIPELAKLVSPNRMAKVIETQAFSLAVKAFMKGDRDTALAYFPAIALQLEESEAAAVQSFLSQTIPDPEWQATIHQTLAEQFGYSTVTIDEVMLAQST